MGMKRKRWNRGFSLIEAMVVLVVFGIVLATAIPNFASSNRRRRVESAATSLSARIQMTRQRTVAKRIPHRLILHRPSLTYWMERQDTDSTWTRFPDEEYCLPHDVEWNVSANGNPANLDVEFEPRGTVLAEDVPLAVTFMNARGDTFFLSLVRTGRVMVRPGAQ